MRTPSEAPAMDRITLRCRDRVLERTFLDDFFEHARTNLASRLEANGELGRILISAATAEHLAGAYASDPSAWST